MAQYTVRMVLHGANSEDYKNLHQQMQQRGFTDRLRADNGTTWLMPDGEYDYRGSESIQQVVDKAESAARAVGKRYGVLATESARRQWAGLQQL